MPVGRLLNHQRAEHCFKNTEMQLRRRVAEVENWCLEMEIILNMEEGKETVEEVSLFK